VRRTKTEQEALSLLRRYKRDRIDFAIYHAIQIARASGSVDSTRLHARLVELGVVAAVREAKGAAELRWYGAVFTCGLFKQTGEFVSTANPGRGVHRGRHANVWRLRPDADLAPYATEPPRPAPIDEATSLAATPRNTPQHPATPLPFEPGAALREITYLDRVATLHGEKPSPNVERLKAWLESLVPTN